MILISSLLAALIPWSPLVPADQIFMGEQLPPIQSERLELPGGEVRLSVSAPDWIRLKRRAEAAEGYCSTAAAAAAEVASSACQLTIDKALERERLSTATDRATISALRLELSLSQEQLLATQSTLEVAEWVAIVGGVATLGLTVGLLVVK